MKILIIGDIYSNSGRLMVEKYLPKVREKYNINFIVANGENIAHGNGITERYYHFLLDQHVNVVTMGNHTWGNAEIFKFINEAKSLVRPLNYPEGSPGVGYVTVKYVREGIDEWYNGSEFVAYKYTNIIFLKFIRKMEAVDTIILD